MLALVHWENAGQAMLALLQQMGRANKNGQAMLALVQLPAQKSALGDKYIAQESPGAHPKRVFDYRTRPGG